jgi:uncharacterized repeat protein (TIGR02543 family)
MKHYKYITDERIIENLKVYRRENFLRKFRLMTISILYSVTMICIIAMIYGSQQQKMTSNVTITYKVPTYTVTFNANGGSCSTSSKSVKFGDNYGDLSTPTRNEYDFVGWYLDGATVTSSTQNTTIGDHTLVAQWQLWPDLPSSAGATFVNTQALQNSSGGRNKRVVQINTTKNASGTARTYKYSWDGSSWSSGVSLVTKTSTGDQTLYVRVYPTGGEHYRNYVQTSTVVHLNKLPNPYLVSYVYTGPSGYWYIRARRKVNSATLVCWASGSNLKISSETAFTDNSDHDVAGWSGWILWLTSSTTGYAYQYLNGFVDSDTISRLCNNDNRNGSAGQDTMYYAQDNGTLTT